MSVKFQPVKRYLKELLDTISFTQLVVFVDANTKKACLPLIEPVLPNYICIEMAAGETFKTIFTVNRVWEELLKYGVDRQAILLNLGGGVVTDLGGFAAGCYKRGIRFINIPTSLLAMVDASVGAKTGIDFCGIKNSIGLFLDPETVIIDTTFLDTLPKRHYNNGKAEILKHGLIANNHHFHQFVEKDYTDDLTDIIKDSVAIKQKIVEADKRESGVRKILNFGHTLGHAIESWSLENEENYLLHGEAIALGMVAEAYLSMKYTNLSQLNFDSIQEIILNYFPKRTYSDSAIHEMLAYLGNDKKNKLDTPQFSLLTDIGNCTYNIECSFEDCKNALKFVLNEV